MKLKKYQDKELKIKKRTFMLLLFVCTIGIGLVVYQSFAKYQDKATFRIINGKLKMSDGSGDIEFVFYNGDQKVDDILTPEKGFIYLGSKCDNGATVKWDNDAWVPTVYNLTETKTSCSLYFSNKENQACVLYPESAACKYSKAGETEEILYDDTEDKNLRYVGTTPNNYVYFNCQDGVEASKSTCERWRIIGIMNNIEDADGSVGSHLKIIRDKFDRNYSWDSSDTYVNRGFGVNEWSKADIEKVLNYEYLNRRTGSHKCYDNAYNVTENCPDWPIIGIRETSRNMISSVKWNTGTFGEDWNSSFYESAEKFNAKVTYEAERSNHTGNELCQANVDSSGKDYCSDKVDRTTTWTGKVGLMYPSDYGYAVGGDVRTTCLKKSMYSYSSDNCITYDWLNDKYNNQWTMIPAPGSKHAIFVFQVVFNGYVAESSADSAFAIRPTLYLKSDVKIVERDYEDYGSIDHPFELEYSEIHE